MRHFKEIEFNCPCCNLDADSMDRRALFLIDAAREFASVPFIINSSIRCKEHNDAIYGNKFSSHLNGTAFDIKAEISTVKFKIISALLKAGFNRVGITKTFIHCDIDPDKPQNLIWIY